MGLFNWAFVYERFVRWQCTKPNVDVLTPIVKREQLDQKRQRFWNRKPVQRKKSLRDHR